MASQSQGAFWALSASTGRATVCQVRAMIFVDTLSFVKQEIKQADLVLNEEISVRRFSSQKHWRCARMSWVTQVTHRRYRKQVSSPLSWWEKPWGMQLWGCWKNLEVCSYEAAERRLLKTGRHNESGQEDVEHPVSPTHQHPLKCYLASVLALSGCLCESV